MADGLRALGHEPICTHGTPSTKHVAVWGWRMGQVLRNQGKEVLVMERGYLGDRFKNTSLAWNGLNGRGTFAPDNTDPARFNEQFAMKPWKQGGDYALIFGQVPGDASLQGRDMMPWYEQAAEEAKAYGLPVKFRQHPLALKKVGVQKVRGAIASTGSLEDDLNGAAVAITWNSNSAVDAVLAGVPTVTMDEGSMAWGVTAHEIGKVVRPDRTDWASALAWKQWTADEIRSGAALVGLLEMVDGH